jgi:hypothetical protein
MLKEMFSAFIGDGLTSLKVNKVCVVMCSGQSNLGVNIIHELCYASENMQHSFKGTTIYNMTPSFICSKYMVAFSITQIMKTSLGEEK